MISKSKDLSRIKSFNIKIFQIYFNIFRHTQANSADLYHSLVAEQTSVIADNRHTWQVSICWTHSPFPALSPLHLKHRVLPQCLTSLSFLRTGCTHNVLLPRTFSAPLKAQGALTMSYFPELSPLHLKHRVHPQCLTSLSSFRFTQCHTSLSFLLSSINTGCTQNILLPWALSSPL